jgi:hypothetical protein
VTLDALIKTLPQIMPCSARYDADSEEWVLDVQQEGGRHQDIMLTEFEENERSLLRLTTNVGRADDFKSQRLHTALELNASLVYGALAIYQGNIVFTETMPLVRDDINEYVDVVRYLTRVADRYEKMLFGVDKA